MSSPAVKTLLMGSIAGSGYLLGTAPTGTFSPVALALGGISIATDMLWHVDEDRFAEVTALTGPLGFGIVCYYIYKACTGKASLGIKAAALGCLASSFAYVAYVGPQATAAEIRGDLDRAVAVHVVGHLVSLPLIFLISRPQWFSGGEKSE